MHDNAFGASIPCAALSELHARANQDLSSIDFGQNCYDVNFIRKGKDLDIGDIIFDLVKYESVFGQMNNEPKIAVEDIFITKDDIQVIGSKEDTLKFMKNGVVYIKFRAKKEIEELKNFKEMRINLVGKCNLNEFRGNVTPQIMIDDLEIFNSEFDF